MSLFLVKMLDVLVKPLGFGLGLVLLGLVTLRKMRTPGAAITTLGVLVLWGCATPLVSGRLMHSLESAHPPRSINTLPRAEAIVVLGGGVTPATPPRLYPDLNAAGDRIWYGARLYQADVAPTVIVSGGQPPRRTAPGAPAMKTFLQDWGLPDDAIVLETESRNTYENAQYTAELCRERGIDRIVLVTSASHMWRALATFRSTSLSVVPAATDYRSVRRPFGPISLLPDADKLRLSTTAVHEYVGYLYYSLRGWID